MKKARAEESIYLELVLEDKGNFIHLQKERPLIILYDVTSNGLPALKSGVLKDADGRALSLHRRVRNLVFSCNTTSNEY